MCESRRVGERFSSYADELSHISVRYSPWSKRVLLLHAVPPPLGDTQMKAS